MKKWVFLGALLVAGCTTLQTGRLDWIAVGPEFHPTEPSQIELVRDRSDITRPFGDLGVLRILDLQPDRDSIRFAVEKARKFIAKKGADAMLLSQYNSAVDGDSTPHVTLVVFAFKYKDTMTQEDEKILEEFNTLGALNENINE